MNPGNSSSLVDHAPTLGSLIERLVTPALLDASDRALLADPGFSRDYHGRPRPRPREDELAACPPGSLGHEYLRFLAHYRLPMRFFPNALEPTKRRPTEHAAMRLVELHDLIHVLGRYETSDGDEVAIQSFVAGQAPVVLALFLRDALGSPTIDEPAYVHLRQLPARPLSRDDVARGRAARSLLAAALERELPTPLEPLRTRLGLRTRVRVPDPGHTNSCGGAPVGPYFTR